MAGDALIQTAFTFVLFPPNELVLPSPTLPSYYCLTSRNKCDFTFRCNQIHKNNNHRFRIFSTPTPKPTSTYISTRKPISLYLMEKLGFSEEQSLFISKKLLRCRREVPGGAKQVTDLISFENADNVITFLQDECGCDHSHIKKVVTKHPRVLGSDIDRTLKPKVKLLQDLGFSTSDLALVLSRNPHFYLLRDLRPAINALRGIMGSTEYVIKVLKGMNYGTGRNLISNLRPNVAMLKKECRIPRDRIRKFLCQQPQAFILLKTESLRDGVVKVQDKWGISRDSAVFLTAVHVFLKLSEESINSKCQVFRSYGWSEDDILTMIKKQPIRLALSEAKIKEALEFYMYELGYEPAYIATRSVMIALNLEKRVLPRHRVLSILKENGHIKTDYQLYSSLTYTDSKFFDRFVKPYRSVLPELVEVYAKGTALGVALPDEETEPYVVAD